MHKNLPRTYRLTLQFDVEVNDVAPEHVSRAFRLPDMAIAGHARRGQPRAEELPSHLLSRIVGDEEAGDAFVRAAIFEVIRRHPEFILKLLNPDSQEKDGKALVRQKLGAVAYSNDSIEVMWKRLEKLAPREVNMFKHFYGDQSFRETEAFRLLLLGVNIQPFETLVEEVD